MLLSAVFTAVCLLATPALSFPQFIPKLFQKISDGATRGSSSLSKLYHLPGFLTGNVDDGVKIVHYSGGNWADILSGLGFFPDGTLSASGVIEVKGISKVSHPYRIGASLQIGGAVIHVDGSSSNRSVVIGDAGSSNSTDSIGNATSITISTGNLDENGFLNGSWGYTPLAAGSIQSYSGSAAVNITGPGGEQQQVVIPVVRPAIPTIVGDESGNTQVQRLTVLNILQSNLINVLSFLLQTSPIISNTKMLGVVETLHNKLLLGQLNVDFILPQLEELMSLSLQEQLQIVLKSFISTVEPDFGVQLQYLINYLKEPKVAGLVFIHQIPNLTGGIDQRWALPWVVARPSYNPSEANSFVNNVLGQLLIQTGKSSDKHTIKYNLYLILTTVPLGLELKTVKQIRNLASILYALNDSIWEVVAQRLPNIPLTSVYAGLKAFLQLVVSIPGVPQQVIVIIENIIPAIPETTAITATPAHITTPATLPRQPENSHPLQPQPQDPPKSQYQPQDPLEPPQLQYPSHQLEAQHQPQYQPDYQLQDKSESQYQSQSQPNYPTQQQSEPQKPLQHQSEIQPEPQHQPQPQHPSQHQTEPQTHSQHQYPHQTEHHQPQAQHSTLPQYSQQPEPEHQFQPQSQYAKGQQPEPHYQPHPEYEPHPSHPQYTTVQSEHEQSAQYHSQQQLPAYQPEPQHQNAAQPGIQHKPQYPPHEIELQSQNQSQPQPQYPPSKQPEPQPPQQSQPQHPPHQTEPQHQPQPQHVIQPEIQHQPRYTPSQTEPQHQPQFQPQPPFPQQSKPQQPPQYQSQLQLPSHQPKPQHEPQPQNATKQPGLQHKPQYPHHEIEPQSQNQSQPQPQNPPPEQSGPKNPPQHQPLSQPQHPPQPQSQPQHSPHKPQSQPQQPPHKPESQHQPESQHATEPEFEHQPQHSPNETERQPQSQTHPHYPEPEPQQPPQYPSHQPEPQDEPQPQPATQPEPQYRPQSQYHFVSQPQYPPPQQPDTQQSHQLQIQPQIEPQRQHQYKFQYQSQTQHLQQPEPQEPYQHHPQHPTYQLVPQYETQHAEPQHETTYAASVLAPASVILTVFPVGGVLDTPSESDLQNPSELLPFCSGYKGCPSIDKIRCVFSKQSVMEFILNLDINVSLYPNKASLLLYILQHILSQVQLQTDEVMAIQHYISYLTTELNPRTIEGSRLSRLSTDVTDILPPCIDKSLYCIILKQINTILHSPPINRYVQDNVYNPAMYPTKEAYLQFILQNLVSRNVLSAKDLACVDLYLQYVKQQQQQQQKPLIVVSGNTLFDILKYLIQPSDAQEQQMFEVLTSWLSKANLAEILGDYKVDLSISAGQLLESMLKYALSHPQVTQNQQLRQIIHHFISKISPSSIAINMGDFVEPLDAQMTRRADTVARTAGETSPVTYKQTINLNAVLRAVDRDRLGESGEQQLIKYFAREFNPDILIQGFQFWKYNTKGTWLKELLSYILHETEVSPSSRALLSRVIPLIRTTGVGAETLEYIS